LSSAEEIAKRLFNIFILRGMLNVSCLPSDTKNVLTPAAADNISAWIAEDETFADIACQAIGYKEGDAGNGAVYVYASKGKAAVLSKIDKEIDGVPIKIRKPAPLLINPEQSQLKTNPPHIYILSDNQKRACGSSCSPSNALFAGTIGAIVKQNEELYLLSNNHVIGGCNHAPLNSIIMSPAMGDSSVGMAPSEIGRLSKLGG
jgi:hypothetical protein